MTRMRLEDVARDAGVSKSIASRVLNGDPELLVRPETRERVVAAARRLNYRPHAAARTAPESVRTRGQPRVGC